MATQTQKNVFFDVYFSEGTIGNVKIPGAPIVTFSLVVEPSKHKVSGNVKVSQAVRGGNFSGDVTGTIYSTGLGKCTKVLALRGIISPDAPLYGTIPFEAHLAIDDEWNGTGGFSYLDVHVENVPVTPSDR